MTQSADAPRSGVAARNEASAHPFTRLSPRGPIKDPSVATELGQIPTLHFPENSLASNYIANDFIDLRLHHRAASSLH